MNRLSATDVVGLLKPRIDAHTLGMLSFARILQDCGLTVHIADETIAGEAEGLRAGGLRPEALIRWIRERHITALGFSFRLDPDTGTTLFAALADALRQANLLAAQGGPVRCLWFGGLPPACEMVRERVPWVDAVFRGDESPQEILELVGLPAHLVPAEISAELSYDKARMEFGAALVKAGRWRMVKPVDRSSSPGYGAWGERVEERIQHGIARGLSPLIRAHVGPWLPDRREAVALFLDWAKRLARGGLLDVLSIGSSQLTQSRFGDNWDDMPNGGGVPINSPAEYRQVWEAARPMLVRTYAGTRNVPAMARMHEESLDICWHALSFWWFSRIDGRGDNTVRQNLEEHSAAMRYIASTGKPLEPNVPHHFAFRGCDDVGYVVSGYVAAKAARQHGIRTLILQTMLNTPRYTWGIQDLAKARALRMLVRTLEGSDFRVYLQPRGGLDYFSPDEEKAKAQLAAVTAMMDDIEPDNPASPQIIHVVSYSEGYRLADPEVVEESVRITRHALEQYRVLKKKGDMPDFGHDPRVARRTEELISEARQMIDMLERTIPDTYSPSGLYAMLAAGVFPLPWLAACREEFAAAVNQRVQFMDGGVHVVDEEGRPLSVRQRLFGIARNLERMGIPPQDRLLGREGRATGGGVP
ncbi:MAG: cobalamin B12-binding domain-containing protein [Spirochaetaceae bacterium]|nr:cobalamin B12-binding domain-containing protein [Spirochaetaceae bacterium]